MSLEPNVSSASIVFVHGLNGHPKRTWTYDSTSQAASSGDSVFDEATQVHCDSRRASSEERQASQHEPSLEVFWPRDLLPKSFPQARVLTWGYNVSLPEMLSSKSKGSVFHHAEVLLADLVKERSLSRNEKIPLIFVAHSLGGIVVKDALSLSRSDLTELSRILAVTIGVIFLGTPHHGSKAASLGNSFAKLTKIALRRPDTKILNALEQESDVLERVSRGFGQVLALGKVRVHSFQEELKTHGLMIVDSQSSSMGYLCETRGTIRADHRNMTKFSNLLDGEYQKLITVLKVWLEERPGLADRNNASALSGIPPSELPDCLIYDEAFEAERHNCLTSLSSPDRGARVRDVKSSYPGTYEWLFAEKIGFARWLAGQDQRPVLWIYGKPGSGKSTLMKFAMDHIRTRRLLEVYAPWPWKIAGYFFHDRGVEVQRSIRGFLGEILHSILEDKKNPSNRDQQREFFTIIYPVYLEVRRRRRSTISGEDNASGWDQHYIQEALRLILTKSQHPLNLCLFIDALDEHDGKHRELITALLALTNFRDSSSVRIRLCVAGRPENVFKDAFRNYPGFAIHEHTTHDIQHYAKDRIRTEAQTTLTDAGRQDLECLVDTVISKARGVFLWVRLVIDEIIEDLADGKTFAELHALVSDIPEELGDLYARVIRRARRISATTRLKGGHEAYIVFQIATCAYAPLSLANMLMAAQELTSGKSARSEFAKLSTEQLERRLNSISCGLLEPAAGDLAWDRSRNHVQFIHQTVKEFMLSQTGQALMQENLAIHPLENGHMLIMKYILRCLKDSEVMDDCLPGERYSDSTDGRLKLYAEYFAYESFCPYARVLEATHQICLKDDFEEVLRSLPAHAQQHVLQRIISDHLEYKWSNSLLRMTGQPMSQLILLYTLCALPLSLKRTFEDQERAGRRCDKSLVRLIVEAALITFDQKQQARAPKSDVVDVLLEADNAIKAESQQIKNLLARLIRRHGSDLQERPKPSSWIMVEIRKLLDRFDEASRNPRPFEPNADS